MDGKPSNKDCAHLWLIFTVSPAFLSYILAVMYDLVSGYNFIQALENHFLEFIMMVFAISFAILGAVVEPTKTLDPYDRAKHIGVSILCCVICIAFYSFLYDPGKNKSVIAIRVLQGVFALISVGIICYGYKFQSTPDSYNCKCENEETRTV